MTPPRHTELARAVRDHAGRLAAALMPLVGDFSAAEDLVADAVEAALILRVVCGLDLTARLAASSRRCPVRRLTTAWRGNGGGQYPPQA